jgi:DNA-binding LacI/PurR family transcriptional regulator
LIGLGHRRIGYICDYLDNPFNFTSSRDRFQGYLQALHAAGVAFRAEYFAQGEHNRSDARRLADEMLRLRRRPTAIFAASDTQAFGVLEAARGLGLRVPEDLSVIGYDDLEISEILGLSTIRQLLYESGRRGVELLLDQLHGLLTEPVCDVLPTELVVRSSTAAPGQDR